MPTLAQLKASVAAHLNTTVANLTISGTDMFLIAANNVRKNAELLHNFEYARVQATLSIDGTTGGSLLNAVVDSGSQDTVTVTGTLSSDATGLYRLTGVYTAKNIYTLQNPAKGAFAIYYNSTQWSIYNWITGHTWNFVSVSSSPVGTYTADGASGATGTATVAVGATWNGLKEVLAVQRTNQDGTLSPLNFTQAETAIERDRWTTELSDNYDLANRYPSDARFLQRGTEGTIIQRRGTLFIYPVPAISSETLAVTLEAYAWLADYDASTLAASISPDFIVTHGFLFLQWGIVCELNYIFKAFVPRQEGNLASPEQAREAAWRDLMLWDTYQVAANATRAR